MNLLFVTWDGPGTTYHETLFMPILQRARRNGDSIDFLQFTWGAADRSARLRRLASDLGMGYRSVEVPHRAASILSPAALIAGGIVIAREAVRNGSDVVLARSILPGGMATLARRFGRMDASVVYDADGLAADEQAEFRGWSGSDPRYLAYRRVERSAVQGADIVLVRTPQALAILGERTGVPENRFVLVVNGKDEDIYQPGSKLDRQDTRASIGLDPEAPVVAYVGSIGPQYEPESMVETFREVHARDSRAHFLVLTGNANYPRIRQLCAGLPPCSVTIRQAEPADVPRYLAIADMGLAYRTPTLSQRAVAPIKVAEYLLCGVPVAYTAGVGDLDAVLPREVARPIPRCHRGPQVAAQWLLDEIAHQRELMRRSSRRHGVQRFSLESAAETYRTAFAAASGGRDR